MRLEASPRGPEKSVDDGESSSLFTIVFGSRDDRKFDMNEKVSLDSMTYNRSI